MLFLQPSRSFLNPPEPSKKHESQKTNEKKTDLGQTTDETLVILEDGIIKELSGKNTIKLGII